MFSVQQSWTSANKSIFLDAALIRGNHRVNVLLSKREMLYFRNIVWKAASMKQMIHSKMLDDENTTSEVLRHEYNIIYQYVVDGYFMQNRIVVMKAGYAVLKWLVDMTRYLEMVLISPKLPSSYERMSLHEFMA